MNDNTLEGKAPEPSSTLRSTFIPVLRRNDPKMLPLLWDITLELRWESKQVADFPVELAPIFWLSLWGSREPAKLLSSWPSSSWWYFFQLNGNKDQ